MAQTPKTFNVYTADGSTRQFAITFPYRTEAEVFVKVDGEDTDFTFATGSTVTLDEVPPAGASVRVERSTSAFYPDHQFQLDAPFLPEYVDANNEQFLYALQETNDQLDQAGKGLNSALETERLQRTAMDDAITAAYKKGDASLQAQLQGEKGLTLMERPVIQWHKNRVENSVDIPPGVNAYSYGPGLEIDPGQEVTVGEGSTWSIQGVGTVSGESNIPGATPQAVPSTLSVAQLRAPHSSKSVDVDDLTGLLGAGRQLIPTQPDYNALSELEPTHGQVAQVMSRWPKQASADVDHVDYGAGLFWYDSRHRRRAHDGGIVLSPTVSPIQPDRSNSDDYNRGVGDTAPDERGCWRRIVGTGEAVNSDWWGRTADALQRALDASSIASGDVVFGNTSYTLDKPLLIHSNTRLIMGPATTLDCPKGVGPALTTAQSESGKRTLLTKTLPAEQYVATVQDSSFLSKGDWVLLGSEYQPRSNVPKLGEYMQVLRINSDGTVVFTADTQFSYSTSEKAFLRKVDFTENVSIVGGQITGNRENSSEDVGVGIKLYQCLNAHVSNVKVSGFHYAGVCFAGVLRGSVRDCQFSDLWSVSNDSSAQYYLGYSVDMVEGSRHVVVDNIQSTRCCSLFGSSGSSKRYGFATQITARNLYGKRILVNPVGTHVACGNIHISNVYSDTPNDSIEPHGCHLRGHNIVIDNMNLRGRYAGVWVQPEGFDSRFVITNSRFVSASASTSGGIRVEPRERRNMLDVVIANCYVSTDQTPAVYISTNVTGREVSNFFDRVSIQGCSLRSRCSNGSINEPGATLEVLGRNDAAVRSMSVSGCVIHNDAGSAGIAAKFLARDGGRIGRVQLDGNYFRAEASCVRVHSESGCVVNKIACNGGDYEVAVDSFDVTGDGSVVLGYHYMNYSDGWQQGTIFN